MSEQARHNKTKKSPKKFMIPLSIVAGLAIVGIWYWQANIGKISTENAYVNATVINIVPRVTGIIKNIYVKNNQPVKKGQQLYTIESEPFQITLAKAQASLEMKQALLTNAETTYARMNNLYNHHAASQNEYENAEASLKSNIAAVEIAKQELAEAQNNLSYTTVTAPDDGIISNLSLGIGDSVHAYQSDFALISTKDFWVDANYKETDIQNIRHGQCAHITLDMYPGIVFKGYVDSLSSGTGESFSLLPPQNATGNWVKVTRRIPVKVMITTHNARFPLRIGASSSVVIDTHSSCISGDRPQ